MGKLCRFAALILVFLAVSTESAGQAGAYLKLNFVCSPTNDLYRLLIGSGHPVERFETLDQAVQALDQGSSLFILADEYPLKPLELKEDLVDRLSAKKISTYAEFVGSWPYGSVGYNMKSNNRPSTNMRVVVTGGWLQPHLKPNTLLSVHNCQFMPLPFYPPLLTLGEVEGFSMASNVPQWVHPKNANVETFTLLGRSPLGSFLLAGTKLSHLVTGRYESCENWRLVWQGIIKLVTGQEVVLPPVSSLVKPSFAKEEPLPEDYRAQALQSAAEWYLHSGLLVHPDWAENTKDEIQPWLRPTQIGDGSLGICEGFASVIEPSGFNMLDRAVTSETAAETAMALALAARQLTDARYRQLAANLLKFSFENSPFGKAAQPEAAADGDARGRGLIAATAAAVMLDEKELLAQIAEGLMANFRLAELQAKSQIENNSTDLGDMPRDLAYLWAGCLLAYHKTGQAAFLDCARDGIDAVMLLYEDNWRWADGIQQERARMLLPMAWLVRVDDKPQHREWLKTLATDLLSHQDSSGAVGEALGIDPEKRPAVTNEENSENASLLICRNGETGADLLNTVNFALLGLHEAFAATGDTAYEAARDKLADFVCRVQLKSILHPELHGSWFRAFNFGDWTYWGADVSPRNGSWSVASGKSHAWLATVLGMCEADVSLWELVSQIDLKGQEQTLQLAPPPGEESAREEVSN